MTMHDAFRTFVDDGDTAVTMHRHYPPGFDEERLDAIRAGAWDEEWWTTLSKTVAIDFDGVLHPYTKGWTGSEPDDEPATPGALKFVKGLIEDGYNVVIFSTRADHSDGEQGIIRWLHKHMKPIYDVLRSSDMVRVTHTKPAAVAYVDDRAVVFRPADGHGWPEARDAIEALANGRAHGAADAPPTAEQCPYNAGGEHVPLASDEGGPVHCRYCQTLLKPRTP